MKEDIDKIIEKCDEFFFLKRECLCLMETKPWLDTEGSSSAKRVSRKSVKKK